MTITQLKYVLAVAKYQNFTIASEHCFVTQPTLSMQIQKLEDQLDIKIFNRSKKPIQLEYLKSPDSANSCNWFTRNDLCESKSIS